MNKSEIYEIVNSNIIERISKGYYKLYDKDISDVKYISIMLTESVVCADSALFYYGYSDRTPFEWLLAVNKDISKSKVKIDYPYIKANFMKRREHP